MKFTELEKVGRLGILCNLLPKHKMKIKNENKSK